MSKGFLVFYSLLLIVTFVLVSTFTIRAEELTPSSQCGCNMKEALKEGDWQKAATEAKTLIKQNPNSPDAKDAYLWLGLYYKSQYDFSKSTEFYQKAATLFPNTWTAAEAQACTGCNYYKMNNYSKALEYFRKSASEAQTWQQRKYASAWAKWVHFTSDGNKQVVSNCATKSINYYLDSKGIKVDKEKLASSLSLKDGLVPLSEILNFLKKEKVKLKAVNCPLDRIKEFQLPVVAVTKASHLIVVKDVGEKIKVYDPVLGDILYYREELAKIWVDKILTLSVPSDKKFASLSRTELNNIFLGACRCCPELPIPSCDADSECCPCCNGAEAGGPGGSSGPGGPGGPGGWGGGNGGNCSGGLCQLSAFGFPQITVYTSSLSLIVRDIPIGYITSLGPDVEVSLTFNSDLAYSGIFGNGWHSNLETQITENPDSSVTLTRSGGHDDTFTYSGGQYNPPVGVSDKLIKNPNNTFTLEFIKSHKKYYFDTSSNDGKILAIEDKNGHTLSYQYDEDNNLFSITDAIGRITEIDTDDTGRITKVTDPLEREANFTYDEQGNLVQVQDMAGEIFTYTYDYNMNITSVTTPKGEYAIVYGQYESKIWVSSITNPEDETYQFGGGVPTYMIDARGNYTYYYQDARFYWPYYGDTVMTGDALSSVRYDYDGDRNRTGITDKRGNTTHYTYDTKHGVTSKTDPLENTWSYTYDTRNNLTSSTDPRGKITEYTYDGSDNLLSVTEKAPGGATLSTISYTYDENGLRTSMTDANSNTTFYEYDTDGNITEITDPKENITTFTYDAIGRKLTMTNATGTTTYEYDNLNRTTKITHPDTTYRQYVYSCCNVSTMTDENGKTTHYEYDGLDRLKEVEDAEDNITTYDYDEVGNLISLKDAENHTTTYTYDIVNRLTSITYPLGDSESYTYDANGNMLTKTDGKGATTTYTYDANNRLTKVVPGRLP